jgi:hypothetical protein
LVANDDDLVLNQCLVDNLEVGVSELREIDLMQQRADISVDRLDPDCGCSANSHR